MFNKFLLLLTIAVMTMGCGEESSSTVRTTTLNIEKIKLFKRSSNQNILEVINNARMMQRDCHDGKGVIGPSDPLVWNNNLYSAALEHSQDMAQSNTFSHIGSGTIYDRTGYVISRKSYFDERIRANGYENFSSLGENIAGGQSSLDEVMESWLRSPEHCANIMNPLFSEIGVSIRIREDSKYGIYWTQSFGDRY